MVTKEQVIKIAKLSKLQIQESELEKFTAQMNQTLEFVKKLDELDTSQVPPTSHAVAMNNAFREDKAIESGVRDKALAVAPDHEANFFKVPKVI